MNAVFRAQPAASKPAQHPRLPPQANHAPGAHLATHMLTSKHMLARKHKMKGSIDEYRRTPIIPHPVHRIALRLHTGAPRHHPRTHASTADGRRQHPPTRQHRRSARTPHYRPRNRQWINSPASSLDEGAVHARPPSPRSSALPSPAKPPKPAGASPSPASAKKQQHENIRPACTPSAPIKVTVI